MHLASKWLIYWFGLALALPGVLAAVAGAETVPSLMNSRLYSGYRIYEQGLLPDGKPLRATRPEGSSFEGHDAACAICHRRSGMGSIEGQLERTTLVPPVAGAVLFAPSRYFGTFLDPLHHYQPNEAWTRVLTRSAYDEASLGRALRAGVDPDGKPLQAPMPRYELDDEAVADLAVYLRSLSAAPSPGVTPDALHLATVVTPDALPEQVDAVLGVVRAWSASAHGGGKPWRMQVWGLAGPSGSWGDQLAARYREQPVFALLSGVGSTDWLPVHRFCETYGVPCVLPSVELAPEDRAAYYSLYFSPGVALEARVLARYLGSEAHTLPEGTKLVQVFSDATGRSAAAALRAGLATDGVRFIDRRFRPSAPAAALEGLNGDEVVVLWLRSEALDGLVETMPQGPAAQVFLSDLLAPSGTVPLPAAWKQRVSYVSLFDDLGLQGEIARMRLQRWLKQAGLATEGDLRLQADAYTACYLFNKAIAEIRSQEVNRPPVPLNRDHVLEMLEELTSKYTDGTGLVDPDSHVAYYGRMSLGPGQRVAVRGGMILRYADADSDKLVAASRRIVP
jgi:hypothetical protein